MIWFNTQLAWQSNYHDAFFADREMYPPLFGFQPPESIEEYLKALRRLVS